MIVLEYFLSFAKEKYKDLFVDGSEYLCEDGFTFMFKTKDSELHRLIVDIENKKIVEV